MRIRCSCASPGSQNQNHSIDVLILSAPVSIALEMLALYVLKALLNLPSLA